MTSIQDNQAVFTYQGFTPTPGYLVITGMYFLAQEELVVKNMPRLLVRLPTSAIEGEELVWSPIILKVKTCE